MANTCACGYTDCLREVNATLSQEKRSCLVFDPVRGGGPLHDIEAECNANIRPQVFGLPEAKRDLIAWHRFKDVHAPLLVLAHPHPNYTPHSTTCHTLNMDTTTHSLLLCRSLVV